MARRLGVGVMSAAAALALLTATAFADTNVTAGETVNWNGQGSDGQGYATTCSTTEWLFVLNQVDPANAGPSSISVKFSDGSTVIFNEESVQGNGTNYHYYSVPIAGQGTIQSAWFVVPNGMRSYGSFVLSHGLCDPGNTPPSPGATPELDSVLLLGAGGLLLGGYGALRRRARRKRSE